MPVCTGPEGASVHSGDQQLKVHPLPDCFEKRYGKIPPVIYVRECYRDLYETASASMLIKQASAATLFTGVPGIGKSLFMVYFIYRFLHDDRFEDKCFAVEFDKGKYVLFRPTANANATEFSCTEVSSGSMQHVNFLLLCDISDAVGPAARAKWTFIFSSPNGLRYEEMCKNLPSYKYTMPTWSEEELMFVNSNRNEWYENFVRYGGVPRFVMHNGGDMEDSLLTKGGAIAEGFFKFSFGAVDLQQSYTLVHINPPSTNGYFQYDGQAMYSFASDYVFRQLLEKHRVQMLAGAAGLFNTGVATETCGAVSAGNLFEKICLWLKPLGNQSITAAPLGGGENVTFVVPAESRDLPNDWETRKELPVNMLILPRIANLQSGDAFFVVKFGSDSFRLVVFQITVGESHPVKVNGLDNIVNAFPEDVRKNITDKLLVFVTPKYGTLDKVQVLHTMKGVKFSGPLPDNVKDFQQYVYRHII